METTVDNAQKNSVASNDEVVAATAQANRINLIMAIAVIVSLLGSMCSPSSLPAASEEPSPNVQSLASATEELSSSISEIGRQMQESARMATDAVGEARSTNDRVSELSKDVSPTRDVGERI